MVSKINCEICHQRLPLQVQIEKTAYEIVPLPKPKFGDYLIIDSISEVLAYDLAILKKIPHEGLTIGRDSSCFITINDRTVSRSHSLIKDING